VLALAAMIAAGATPVSAADPGVDSKSIVLGATAPLSRGAP
jgi:hypothetical protein